MKVFRLMLLCLLLLFSTSCNLAGTQEYIENTKEESSKRKKNTERTEEETEEESEEDTEETGESTVKKSKKSEAQSSEEEDTKENSSEEKEEKSPTTKADISDIEILSEQHTDYIRVQLSRLPENAEELGLLAEGKLSSPEYVAAFFICAIQIFTENTEEGIQALEMLNGPEDLSTHDNNWYKDRLQDKPYLPKAYFEGAVPENDYTPGEPYTLYIYPDSRPDLWEEGLMKVYLRTSGADSPRGIQLREHEGSWYIWNISAIMSGIRLPASMDPWS